jgi:hypothetical protein
LTGLISTLQAMEIYVVTAVYPAGRPSNPHLLAPPGTSWHLAPEHSAPTTSGSTTYSLQ